MARESDRIVSKEHEREFVLAMLAASDKHRQEDKSVDNMVIRNYMVQPKRGSKWAGTAYPYAKKNHNSAIMADPETHQIIETLLAILMLSTITDKGFVQASPVGREDAKAAKIVSKLLERTYRVNQNHSSMYMTYKDALLFGTAIQWPFWDFRDGVRPVNVIEFDPLTGEEFVTSEDQLVTLYDDVDLNPVDIWNFFYDPHHNRVADMLFGAIRFVIPASVAQRRVDEGRYSPEATRRAINAGGPGRRKDQFEDDDFREAIDRKQFRDIPAEYKPLVGYEMYAQVPYKTRDGRRHRRLTILNGELVESRPSPLRSTRTVPAYEFVVNPILGRFRGVAPGAVARFTQDFTNGMLMTLADATVKKARQPIIYNRQVNPDVSRLAALKGPIPVQGDISQVRELQYNPPLQEAFAMYQQMKLGMEQSSAAQAGVQGQGLGTKRFSATETQLTFQSQLSRPEMMAALFENQYLPEQAKGVLELSQQFILDRDDLALRIGESAMEDISLEDIQGDFDLEFVGSSKVQSRQLQMQFIERAFQVFGSIPGAAPLFPWAEGMIKWLELADMRELEEMVAQKSGVEDFIGNTLAQTGAANPAAGNGNASTASLAPAGLQPAQAVGGLLGA